jgi:proteic killer suppression protein
MKPTFQNKKIEALCTNPRIGTQKFGSEVEKRLLRLMNAIYSAVCLNDIACLPQYRFHQLHGNLKGQYSLTIWIQSKWRLIVYPLDKDGSILTSGDNEKGMLARSVMVLIEEVSEHYEK